MPVSAHDVSTELDDLLDRLADGEGLEVEFKRASGGIPNSIWPTICAFANTNGGWIVLGVDEQTNPPVIEGFSNPSRVIDDLYSQMRGNTAKISTPICGPGDVYVEALAGREVVAIRVRPAHRRQKPIYLGENPFRGTYIRLHTGDHHCSEYEVRRMLRESLDDSIDAIPLPYLRLDALDQDALRGYRQRYQTRHPASHLNDYDDRAFLEAVRGYGRDEDAGVEGITVAGLLMFGTASRIRDWRRRHLIDYRRSSDHSPIGWDERIVHEEGLFRAFERIYPRLVEDSRVPFKLNVLTGERIDEGPEHVALREALINLLVHADYQETAASLIDQTPDGILFRNPGDSRSSAAEMLAGKRAEPRNPELVLMFRLIGLVEEAGTGIPRIMHAWRELGLRPPVIQTDAERYEFSIQLRHVHLLSPDDRAWLASLGSGWSEAEQLALTHAREVGYVDNATIRTLTSLHPADATKLLTGLRDRGFLIKDDARGGPRTRYLLGLAAVRDGDAGTSRPNSVDHRPNSVDHTPNSVVGVAEEERLVSLAASVHGRKGSGVHQRAMVIIEMCRIAPLSKEQLQSYLGMTPNMVRAAIKQVLADGRLRYRYPDTPNHPLQQYIAADAPVPDVE